LTIRSVVDTAPTMTRERAIEIADWIVDTCLTFGTSVVTAYKVAALFIEALENEGKVTR
jgi:hypothetical protein